MLGREPVLWMALVQAALGFGNAFGLSLTPIQTAAALGLSGAILAFVVRSQVTPTAPPPVKLP